jgi:hypothetical protein
MMIGLVLVLVGTTLAHGVARAAEAAAPHTWTDKEIEEAFHDVLAHGDLSDIGFLARTLGLDLEVVQWEKASAVQKGFTETAAIVKKVPSYLPAYGTFYNLKTNLKEGTTRIDFRFEIKSCPSPSPWGMDWNQQVQTAHGLSSDDGPAYGVETIRWREDVEGVVLERTTDSNGGCSFTLAQNKHATFSVPKPPMTVPGPGTELLEQVIDLVVAGDLRDYLATAHILHTELSTYGKLRGRLLYEGGAEPEQIIPGTDTRFFMYFVNDTGVIDVGAPVFIHRRGPRSARLSLSVDVVENCISADSLEAGMRQRHIRFQKKTGASGPYLRVVQRGNVFSLGYYPQGSCIEEFDLEQETER